MKFWSYTRIDNNSRRTKSIEELIPWLYLKGLSTGDYSEALCSLLGEQAKGLSANTVSRLKSQWLDEHQTWQRQDLSQKRYVYWWADGIYSQVRMDERLCLLVIIGVTEQGDYDKEDFLIRQNWLTDQCTYFLVLKQLPVYHFITLYTLFTVLIYGLII